ncbi:MAG: NADH-quinone oxidoreductase subunit NuoE [Candidatus Zixiibacteriota bacterium]
MVENLEKVNTIMDRYKGDDSALISILQDIQDEYNYLPEEALRKVAQTLDIPLIDIYSVTTFYKSFSLTPRGKHLVTVCLGTACHVRGGRRILGEVVRKLNIAPGETTEDKLFTLETVNCLGCCAIGPIVVVDGEYYGEMTVRKVDPILEEYRQVNSSNTHTN